MSPITKLKRIPTSGYMLLTLWHFERRPMCNFSLQATAGNNRQRQSITGLVNDITTTLWWGPLCSPGIGVCGPQWEKEHLSPGEESCCLRALGPTVHIDDCMAGWRVPTLLAYCRVAGDTLPKRHVDNWIHSTLQVLIPG